MAGVFDTYSDVAFATIETVMGEDITFIASDARYSSLDAYGLIDDVYSEPDDFGGIVIQQKKRVTVAKDQVPEDVNIGDDIEIVLEEKTYTIIDIKPDVNSSSVFYLSE
jgi:hypothetical protein